MTCGIYSLQNKVTKECYVGRSNLIELRVKKHLADIANKLHSNSRIRKLGRKYGPQSFEFQILQTCHEKNLARREREWIIKLKPQLNMAVPTLESVRCYEEAYKAKQANRDGPILSKLSKRNRAILDSLGRELGFYGDEATVIARLLEGIAVGRLKLSELL